MLILPRKYQKANLNCSIVNNILSIEYHNVINKSHPNIYGWTDRQKHRSAHNFMKSFFHFHYIAAE